MTPFELLADAFDRIRDKVHGVVADLSPAVHVRTLAFLATTSDADLDAIVDDRWDPPVTLGARLISIVADDLQHVGQAADARGILHRT